MDIKGRILYFIRRGKIEEAYKLSRDYIRQYQTDEQFVILYIMLGIAKDENEAGVIDMFSTSPEKDINELLAHYQNIKFCVRRFEYEMGEQAREQAMEYFRNFNVSLYAIVYIVQYACVDQKKAVYNIADYYEKNNDLKKANLLRDYCLEI